MRRKMVGAARFERAAPCTPCRCATWLRHAPTGWIISCWLGRGLGGACQRPYSRGMDGWGRRVLDSGSGAGMTGWGGCCSPAYTPAVHSPFESLRTNGRPRWVQKDAVRAGGGTVGGAAGDGTLLVDRRSGFRLGGRNDGLGAGGGTVGGAAGDGTLLVDRRSGFRL